MRANSIKSAAQRSGLMSDRGLRTGTLFIVLLAFMSAAQAGILEAVRERGHIVCGVAEGQTGFSQTDQSGRWTGIDVEFCTALAAAVIGDKSAVKFRAIARTDGAKALNAGDVDVLLGGLAWTFAREGELGMRAVGVLLHDGQGILIKRSFGIGSVLELSGSTICVASGSSFVQTLNDYFGQRLMRVNLIVADKWENQIKAYIEGQCTAMSGPVIRLAIERSRMHTPMDHVLLPELLSLDMSGPMVRQGDDAWFTIVRWVLFSLIRAEELGLSTANVNEKRQIQESSQINRFLDGTAGLAVGLMEGWVHRVVEQVGNYADIYERTLGEQSQLKLSRGRNNLWSGGGLLAAPAF